MQFISPDTIIPAMTNPQSLNRYVYVNNRPINLNDPTGHVACLGKNWDDGPQCKLKAESKEMYDKKKHPENFSPLSCPSPIPESRICPTKKVFLLKNVDWIDIGINVAGIIGDAGLDTSEFDFGAGVGPWALTEIVEGIGVAKDLYEYNKTGDLSALYWNEGVPGVLKFALKHSRNAKGLIPVVGFVFNGVAIIQAFGDGWTDVADCSPQTPTSPPSTSPPTIGPKPK